MELEEKYRYLQDNEEAMELKNLEEAIELKIQKEALELKKLEEEMELKQKEDVKKLKKLEEEMELKQKEDVKKLKIQKEAMKSKYLEDKKNIITEYDRILKKQTEYEQRLQKQIIETINLHDTCLELTMKDSEELRNFCIEMYRSPSPKDYQLDLKDYKYISGPLCMHVLRSQHLCIMLFGEQHYEIIRPKGSIPTELYLNKLIERNKDKSFDMYVEADTEEYKQTGTVQQGIGKMNQLIQLFLDCIDSKKCSNVRFHPIDARDSLETSSREVLGYIKEPRTEEEIDNNINVLFDKIKKAETIKGVNLDTEVIKYPKLVALLKEINAIDEKPEEFAIAKKALLKFYYDTFSIGAYIRKAREYILELDLTKLSDGTIDKKKASIITRNIYLSNDALEVYTLTRMFSSYKTEPNHARNMILYAGDAHVTNILNFLMTELNMKVVYTNCNYTSFVKAPVLEDLEKNLI